jgi:ubiquinone/menaquinone biosynthesis C-methylase UbiE
MDAKTDYQAQYDGYWESADRIGESSGDLDRIAEQILMTCGVGRTLDVGSGEGMLVTSLLRRGVDAHGVDVSEVVTARCNGRVQGRFTHGSVLALPFEDDSFQTVVSTDCMEHLAPEDVPKALKEIHRVTSRHVFLQIATTRDRDGHWHLTVEGRAWWETKCFEAGFRKHAAYYKVNPYESLNEDGWQITIVLEKIPEHAHEKYPLSALAAERDLHTDMLRESGSRSDAHVGRYYFSAKFIRPGDAVLDAACGLGYGTHVLRTLTKARSFIGIDGSDYAIDYANHNFGVDTIHFRHGLLPDYLANIPDNSVDHVLCFETLEHVQDPVRLLSEFHRLLTPGGRITCSVPHDWSDITGVDPNPFHLHVYNKERFFNELSQFFDIEHFVGQTADRVKQPGGDCVWLKRPRSMVYLDLDQSEIEAEWFLAVAARSPLGGHKVPYQEQVFSKNEVKAAGHALAFERDYSNPWLIRSMVSIGLRTENLDLRKRWAMGVLEERSARTADRGAALCVLAYGTLERGCDHAVEWLMSEVDTYLAETECDTNPTALRWRVSLMFVCGRLALSRAQFDEAIRFFRGVVSSPGDRYSATLLTKPAEAAYLLGLLLASQGRQDEALLAWWNSFRQISVALGNSLAQGYEVRPPTFEIREMASALLLCGRLVAAADRCADIAMRPSIFYDETNIASHTGKEWLESQSMGSDSERVRLKDALTELQTGKEWLESQWKVHKQQIEVYENKMTRLKRNIFIGLAKKVGFFKFID